MTGTFIAPSRAVRLPRWVVPLAISVAVVVPLIPNIPYALQVLTNSWLMAMLAISLTLVAGTLYQIPRDVTRRGFPKRLGFGSRRRTMEFRHADAASVRF